MVGGLSLCEVKTTIHSVINKFKRYDDKDDLAQDLLCRVWEVRGIFNNFSQVESKKMIRTISNNFIISKIQKQKRGFKNKKVLKRRREIIEECERKSFWHRTSIQSDSRKIDNLIQERQRGLDNLLTYEGNVFYSIKECSSSPDNEPVKGVFCLDFYNSDDINTEDKYLYKELKDLVLNYIMNCKDPKEKQFLLLCVDCSEQEDKESKLSVSNIKKFIGISYSKVCRIQSKLRNFLKNKGYDC